MSFGKEGGYERKNRKNKVHAIECMHCILVLLQLILSSHRKLNWRYMILTLNFIAVDLIECRSAFKIDSVSTSPRSYILLLTIMLREILRKPFRCGCGHLVLEYIFKCFSKKSVPSCWPLLLSHFLMSILCALSLEVVLKGARWNVSTEPTIIKHRSSS